MNDTITAPPTSETCPVHRVEHQPRDHAVLCNRCFRVMTYKWTGRCQACDLTGCNG